jgi:hypothetical protein
MVYNAPDEADVREDIVHRVADGLLWTRLRRVDIPGAPPVAQIGASGEREQLNPDPNMVFEPSVAASGTLGEDQTFGYAAGSRRLSMPTTLRSDY